MCRHPAVVATGVSWPAPFCRAATRGTIRGVAHKTHSPIREEDMNMSWPEWAARIWPVLTATAHYRATILYERLGELIGFGGVAAHLGDSLGRIAVHCHKNGWPILPSLVVNKTGDPGPGIPSVQTGASEREQVYRFPWFQQPPVSPNDFAVPASQYPPFQAAPVQPLAGVSVSSPPPGPAQP